MSKAKAVEVVSPVSLKDAAYRQAVASDTTRSTAKYVLDVIPSYPDNATDEQQAELTSGWHLRWDEVNPEVEYAVIDGNYLPVSSLKKVPEGTERINVGLGFAMSFTQQAFGALGNDKSSSYNAKLHALLKVYRDKISKYCGNRKKELIAKIKSIQNEGKTSTRVQADTFVVYMGKTFDAMHGRCKTAKKQRGDETANEELFLKAHAAYMQVWNAGK
jgi:hypothetical protein